MSANILRYTPRMCQCCRKVLRLHESYIQTTQKTLEIFKNFIGYNLLDGVICSKCNINLLNFDIFQRDIRQKYSILYEDINGILQICDEEAIEEKSEENYERQVKVKDEPIEHQAVITVQANKVEANDVSVSHIKTEPEDEPEEEAPWINVDNIIVKEEYEINEEAEDEEMIAEFMKTTEELETESILIRSRELVLKANVKRNVRGKNGSKPKRFKSLALMIPDGSIKSFDKSITETVKETVIVRDAFNTVEYHNSDPTWIPPVTKDLKKFAEPCRVVEFQCEHCTVVNRSRELVVRHIKEAHAFRCNVCLRIFPNKFKMDRHKEAVHNMSPQAAEGSRRKQTLQPMKEDQMMMFRLRSKR